jgi:hypothetical protein
VCAISRICVCYFIVIKLHGPLIYRLTRKITNAYKQNLSFLFTFIYYLFVLGPWNFLLFVLVHETSLTLPLFIEVPVSSQVSVRSCIVVW